MKKLLIAALALMFLLSGCTAAGTQQATATPAAASASPEATPSAAATAEPTPSPTPEATPAPTEAPAETPTEAATPAPDATANAFATAEVTLDTVEAAVTGLFKDGEFYGVSTDNSAGNIYVTIWFKPASYADEKDFVLQAGRQAVPVLETLFANQSVLEVFFYADADLKNADGDTANTDVLMLDMTKDKYAAADWAKLKEAASTDYQAMLGAVDSYTLLPEFSDKLK